MSATRGRRVIENRFTVSAATLAVCAWAALALVSMAQGSNAHSGNATGPASTTAQTYCAELQHEIGAQGYRFSGWRCNQGPNIRGQQTILAWVKVTRITGTAELKLIWLAESEPARDAPVIDVISAPQYGYEPNNVTKAFRMAAEHPPAFTA
jgi:hypothetical protein